MKIYSKDFTVYEALLSSELPFKLTMKDFDFLEFLAI